jgi:uncharacterized RDD family membrane protein YckC
VIGAFLVAVIPLVTVLVIGHARSVRECPDPLPPGRSCVAWQGNGVVVENRSIVLFFVFLALLYVVVFVIVQGRTGASPGKALLGIRVVCADGTKTGMSRSFVRAIFWVIAVFRLRRSLGTAPPGHVAGTSPARSGACGNRGRLQAPPGQKSRHREPHPRPIFTRRV